MEIIHDISTTRKTLDPLRPNTKIGLVPTMGALHEGHLTLIREARKENDFVVVSIFVNPTQFGPNEDLDRYPRTLESDAELCKKEGVSVIFAPSVNEMYPDKHHLSISIEQLDTHLCGASRPGHFNGVLQVVNKLFQIIQPNNAYFGQKDIQQFVLIQTMVHEFNIPVKLVAVPTVREIDGLALSSRNRYLSDTQRKVAPELYKSIQSLALYLKNGFAESVNAAVEFIDTNKRYPDVQLQLKKQIDTHKEHLTAIGFKIDYLEVVDFNSLQPIELTVEHDRYIVAIAAWIGNTRLIDNIIVEKI